MAWETDIKIEDATGEKAEVQLRFDARPTISMGEGFLRVYSEDDGELWLPTIAVIEVRSKPKRDKSNEETGI